jgi:hypothetical protein
VTVVGRSFSTTSVLNILQVYQIKLNICSERG